MHSDGIWHDLELQKKLKTMSLKHALWRYLKRLGNAECYLKTISLKHAFWRYFNKLGNAEFYLKPMSLKHAFWWYLTRFGTAEKKPENNVS